MSHSQCPSCKTTDCERHRLLEESIEAQLTGKATPSLMQSEKYGAAALECRRRAAKAV